MSEHHQRRRRLDSCKPRAYPPAKRPAHQRHLIEAFSQERIPFSADVIKFRRKISARSRP
jgi:hypothetical protein